MTACWPVSVTRTSRRVSTTIDFSGVRMSTTALRTLLIESRARILTTSSTFHRQAFSTTAPVDRSTGKGQDSGEGKRLPAMKCAEFSCRLRQAVGVLAPDVRGRFTNGEAAGRESGRPRMKLAGIVRPRPSKRLRSLTAGTIC